MEKPKNLFFAEEAWEQVRGTEAVRSIPWEISKTEAELSISQENSEIGDPWKLQDQGYRCV